MKLNIFGLIVSVKVQKLDQENLRGLYNTETNEIFIAEGLPKKLYTETLLHEIIHAVLYRTGFGQTQMPHDLHEMICENVSVAINENFDLKPRKTKP